jgi:anti-sigma-K factor RskA
MNHPKPEVWGPYVYGETKGSARRELSAHLADCGECREMVQGWQRTMRGLDAWKLPRAGRVSPLVGRLRWAAAAACVLALGFGWGRLSAGRMDTEALRARLEPQLREELRQDLTQLLRQEIEHKAEVTLAAAGDQTQKLLTAYTAVNETRRAEELAQLYATIKKQLDTLAINTQQGLVQLATYQPPTRP